MANDEQLKILKRGVTAWNRFQRQLPRLGPLQLFGPEFIDADLSDLDLTGAIFSGGRLMGADFRDAKLNGVDFRKASISGAFLWSTALVGANFEDGIIADAHFVNADLSEANLKSTDASFVILQRTKLDGTDFSHCEMQSAFIADCDLSNAYGLEDVRHLGPSHIGLDTIYKSKGRIPEIFLRGCGVPESFITQIGSLIGAEDSIQFYSCFISHSTRDEEFAKRLHGRMRDAHLRVWFAPEDIKAGKKLYEQIETAIRVYDKLLVVLSQASLQSEWVMTELRNARKAERQSGKRKLFPVRLVDFETLRDWECFDADSGKDLAVELREYFIPDFSNWKDHDQFEAAFARLLKDLRAEDRAA
jgi:uncharacterized protein YjbI with pentapeptide repeats